MSADGRSSMVVLLAAVETLASYISRVYSEFGKILSREVQENLDAWEERIEPQLGLRRDHAALSRGGAAATGAGHHCAGVRRGALRSRAAPGPAHLRRNRAGRAGGGAGGRLLQPALPSLLFNRTQGRVGGADDLADPPVAVARDADHGLRALLLFCGRAGRGAGEPAGRSRCRCGGAARSRRRRGNSGGERPRPGALGGGVRRQAGARGDDAAAAGLRGPGIDDAGAVSGSAEGAQLLARAGLCGFAGQRHRHRVCARPAADYR